MTLNTYFGRYATIYKRIKREKQKGVHLSIRNVTHFYSLSIRMFNWYLVCKHKSTCFGNFEIL